MHTDGVIPRGERALALCRPDGGLHDRPWAPEPWRAATKPLVGPAWGKGRRWRRDARSLHDLDGLPTQWAEAVAAPRWREACPHVWHLHAAMPRTHGEQHARLAQAVALGQALGQRLWPEWPQASARVAEILPGVVRARSAVACVNSVVRMHQARHRHISQGLLDRKRLSWHWRAFQHGKRQGACPYALLGLQLSTYDWWTLLQMDPKAVEQKLSTQKLVA